jgi:hypothetical protein
MQHAQSAYGIVQNSPHEAAVPDKIIKYGIAIGLGAALTSGALAGAAADVIVLAHHNRQISSVRLALLKLGQPRDQNAVRRVRGGRPQQCVHATSNRTQSAPHSRAKAGATSDGERRLAKTRQFARARTKLSFADDIAQTPCNRNNVRANLVRR